MMNVAQASFRSERAAGKWSKDKVCKLLSLQPNISISGLDIENIFMILCLYIHAVSGRGGAGGVEGTYGAQT